MKIGMNDGRLIALHEDRWFAVGAAHDDDVLTFLAAGLPAVEQARDLINRGDAPEAAPETWITASTHDARYDHADAVAYAATAETLYLGDLLTSGTVPRCCGLEMNRYPRQGDTVELRLLGIGTLTNTITV